jgi:hypothetical protein
MAGRADNDPPLRVHSWPFLAIGKRMVAPATVSLSSISIEYSAACADAALWRLVATPSGGYGRSKNGYQQHVWREY